MGSRISALPNLSTGSSFFEKISRIDELPNFNQYKIIKSLSGVYLGFHLRLTQFPNVLFESLILTINSDGLAKLDRKLNSSNYGYFKVISDGLILGVFDLMPDHRYYRFRHMLSYKDGGAELEGISAGKGRGNFPSADRIFFIKVDEPNDIFDFCEDLYPLNKRIINKLSPDQNDFSNMEQIQNLLFEIDFSKFYETDLYKDNIRQFFTKNTNMLKFFLDSKNARDGYTDGRQWQKLDFLLP